MSTSADIKRIQKQLPLVMSRDRMNFSEKLEKIRQRCRGQEAGGRIFQQLAYLQKKVHASIRERKDRQARKPSVTFPKSLPITGRRDKIIGAIRKNQVVIISGETGSGKSTQIPKMCLEAGRGIGGKIGCTQPRRIAATTIAKRIAQELGEETGRSVGYKIRFRDKTAQDGYIKIMTDGILLMETQQDPLLHEYDTLIIDEAHERSLNIDFLLGILKTLLPLRPDLKLIITSATLDTEKFSKAFAHGPVVRVGGRMYPVEVSYMPLSPELEEAGEVTYVDMAIQAVERLRRKGGLGDILIFMPTEQDILETCERLEGHQLQGTAILPLFARLSGSEQERVYTVSGPKIVVATNVAETSLTIPGIKYVIDTGLARISQYMPATRTTSLPISPISRSSADQRKGRCGRVQNGVCIRLYSQDDYEKRQAFTPPEILRSNLAEVILRMISLNLGDIASFPFVDKPHRKSIKDGFDLLVELGAIVRNGKRVSLTDNGRIMARMPLDPKISRMIIAAQKEGCVKEVSIIAAALSIQDPRERPLEKAAQADQIHAPFKDAGSDFITLLNIWNRYHRSLERFKTQNKMRKFCKEQFLSFPRMREWIYINQQINTILKEQRIAKIRKDAEKPPAPLYEGIHRSILSGFISNIAMKKDKNIYLAAKGREAMIFPGSTLFNNDCPWIVAAEMVKTSRLFARTTAKIDPQWLEAIGGNLCKHSYSHPHWEKNRGEVRALEQVSLFGLPIVSRRPVSYGPINPKDAHDIFVQSALVEGDMKDAPAFLIHNQSLVKKIVDLENKVRRRDILVSESVLAEFYTVKLEGVHDTRTLSERIEDRGGDDFLKMREEDLLISRPDEAEIAQYPDHLSVGQSSLDCSYRFAPGKQDDGVTINIPLGQAAGLPLEPIEWGVPGLLREKITALIKGLPKRYRKQLVPVPDTVDIIMEEMKRTGQSLITALARFVYQKFCVDIPATEWSKVEIPDHLKIRVSITDHRGRKVASGRDPSLLRSLKSPSQGKSDSAKWKKAKENWEKTGLISWDFGPLPEKIPVDTHLIAYPGLEAAGDGTVNIRLFTCPVQALESHKRGVQALFAAHFRKELKFTKKNLRLSGQGARGADYFGGPEMIEQALYQRLLQHLFKKDFRSQDEFDAYASAVVPLSGLGKELRNQAIKILDAYSETRTFIYLLENANKNNQEVSAFCGQMRKNVDTLVPGDFIEIYEEDRLRHIPRYLKAIEVRSERFAHDPEKDRIKFSQVEMFLETLPEIIDSLSVHSSQGKREAVEHYRWMIEEFKVSLFAQELKTPYPVSEKRLKAKQKEIERMV